MITTARSVAVAALLLLPGIPGAQEIPPLPELPTLPSQPTLPALPTFPAVPTLPSLPAFPELPAPSPSQAAPVAPVGPVGPVAPVAPAASIGPVAPVRPVAPSGGSPRALLAQRDSRTKTLSHRFQVRGRSVAVRGNAMDLDVVVGTGDEASIELELEYWSSSDEWMRSVADTFDLTVTENSNRVEIEAQEMPEISQSWLRRMIGRSEVSWAMRGTLRLPAGTELDLRNRYGNLEVTGIGGDLTVRNTSGDVTVRGSARASVDNSYGAVVVSDSGPLEVRASSTNVEARGIRGAAQIVTSYGQVAAEGIEGRLDVELSSGDLDVRDVRGAVVLRNSYGTTQVRTVTGDLTVRTSSGEVIVEDVEGRATIEGSYGAISASRVRRGVEISSPSGAVTLTDIGGDSSVRNSYAPVRAADVNGALRIEGASSAVSVAGVGGSLEVETSYAGVEIRDVGGSVKVRNQSGRVEVRELRDAALGLPHTIETSYANVRFGWPSGRPFTFEAECSYGRIDSDFEGTREDGSSRQRFSGGNAGPRVRLVASNGSIAIRKE